MLGQLEDYYRILGVTPDASQERIRSQWRTLSKRAHPDHGGTAEEFRLLHEAYTVLSDPDARASYDAARRGDVVDAVDAVDAGHPANSAEPETPEDAWVPSRTLLRVFAIAMTLVVIVVLLLMPAVMATNQ